MVCQHQHSSDNHDSEYYSPKLLKHNKAVGMLGLGLSCTLIFAKIALSVRISCQRKLTSVSYWLCVLVFGATFEELECCPETNIRNLHQKLTSSHEVESTEFIRGSIFHTHRFLA